MKILYGGWLYGNKGEEKELADIGVRGLMEWKKDDNPFRAGIFECCICDADTLLKLDERYFEMWSDDFKKKNYFFRLPSKRFVKLGKSDLKVFQ